MNIEVGSKWIRHSLYKLRPKVGVDYFLGQEVEITSLGYGVVWFKLYTKSGALFGKTNIENDKFISHFSPLNISLENK